MLAVDYFSRKVYGAWVKHKKPSQTIKLFSEVATELKIRQLNMDNGREFRNALVGEWCIEKEINIRFFESYVHESNERIESVNRIIREMLKRTKYFPIANLRNVIYAYNNKHHRSIGMSPNETIKPEA
ncbi:hypothetical protein CDIK_2843 [Cucumispora dikerogammari]|nr:hypothetical protein CDIK_2843 [Cucumispora dikerogammari]